MKSTDWETWWSREVSEQMHESADRRESPRRPARGEITLTYSDPDPKEIAGILIDVSEYGFRAAHHDGGLRSGQVVRFFALHAMGEARVAWTRQVTGRTESGFAILSQESIH